jgi:hypothetical protein
MQHSRNVPHPRSLVMLAEWMIAWKDRAGIPDVRRAYHPAPMKKNRHNIDHGTIRFQDLPAGGEPRNEDGSVSRIVARDPRDPMAWRVLHVQRGGRRQSYTSPRCGRRQALLHAAYLLCRATQDRAAQASE